MSTVWLEGPRPNTKFAPNFRIPVYIGYDGTKEFMSTMRDYVLEIEKTIIEKEELVSKVPKSGNDPYKHTQQWKQHNIFNDVPGLGGEHLDRFPKNKCVDDFFNLLRTNYLEHIATLRYPRIKVYINGWANVLRKGEWISMHNHMSHTDAYLSGTYYLTTVDTCLWLVNPAQPAGEAASELDQHAISTEARKLILFPSWVPHYSSKYEGDDLRISLAVDIITESTMKGNPWRPHVLFDDPDTMPGLVR
jgi:hypothetical protein